MKKDIHPKYYPKAKIACACGHVMEVGSTVENISVEVCSACHPLYTGKQKFIDKAGRVEKFRERAAKSIAKKTPRAGSPQGPEAPDKSKRPPARGRQFR